LYATSLLVVLVAYFGRDIQNIMDRQVHWKTGDILLLTLEIGNSFSQFLKWDFIVPAYILSILST